MTEFVDQFETCRCGIDRQFARWPLLHLLQHGRQDRLGRVVGKFPDHATGGAAAQLFDDGICAHQTVSWRRGKRAFGTIMTMPSLFHTVKASRAASQLSATAIAIDAPQSPWSGMRMRLRMTLTVSVSP